MKEKASEVSSLNYINAVVLSVSAIVAIGYAVAKTPVLFWGPAWAILTASFAVAFAMRKACIHWPSTVFGTLEIIYVITLVVALLREGVSFEGVSYMFFGLVFVHGILYYILAKPWLLRRGHITPKQT